MRYIIRTTIAERREQPVLDYLFSGELPSEVCTQTGSSPGALILDHLVPNRRKAESFPDWLCRQVREILVQHIQTDDWQGEDDAWVSTRTERCLDIVELTPEDRNWILARYGNHPEVLAVWEAACNRQEQKRAA